MLGTSDHKNKDIMKLVNPSIFDYFQAKNELSVKLLSYFFIFLGLGNIIFEISLQLYSQMFQMS